MKQEIQEIRQIFDLITAAIANHGWTKVGKRLGLTDLNLQGIKETNPRARKIDLARQVLCHWDEQCEQGGSLAKLIKALRAEGLNDAADMISKYVIVPRSSTQSNVRRQQIQMKRERARRRRSRVSEEQPVIAPIQLPEEALEETSDWAELLKGFTPDSEDTTQATKCIYHRKRQKGELYATVRAKRLGVYDMGVGPPNPKTEGKMLHNSKLRKLYQYYDEVVHKQMDYIRALSKLMHFQGAIIRGMFVGSITVVVYCDTLDGLGQVKKSYSEGQLLATMRTVLKDDTLMKKIGISDLDLRLTVTEEDFEACEREINDKLAPVVAETPEEMKTPTVSCASLGIPNRSLTQSEVKQCHIELRGYLEDIQANCECFLKKKQKVFCSALDLVRPPYVDEVSTMAQMNSYKRKLRDMFSGEGKWVQVVKDFEEVLRSIEGAIEATQDNINAMEMYYEKKNQRPEILVSMISMLEHLGTKLDPSFDMGSLVTDDFVRSSGLKCYAPIFAWLNRLLVDLEQLDHALVQFWRQVASK